MDANTLVDTYIKHLGLKRISGDDASPILPFFILDVMYTLYRKSIQPVPSQFEEKKAKNLWMKNYHLFNRDFFSVFSDDQQDEIIDIMDAFEEYINNDVVIVKVAVMNELSPHGLNLDDQDILASCLICDILAQSAQVIWRAVYDNDNQYINAIMRNATRWMNLYIRKRTDALVDTNKSKQVTDAVNALCKKMVNFLHKLRKNEDI